MNISQYNTTISDILKEYGDFEGEFIIILEVFDYWEAVLLLGTKKEKISKSILKYKNINAEVLNNSGLCHIISNIDTMVLGQRYERCDMAETKVTNIEEENIDYADDSLFNINSWGADLSFRELIMMYDDEELIKPELQRKYVWTKDEASKFIDSLLLGLPVPSVFLAKVNDQKLIIDGYQRIMTVYDYIKGIFSGDNRVFKLTSSEAIHPKWRGKAYSELPKEEQRRIASTTIHAIIFEQKQPANDSGMYKIFERINTSGRNLKPQEIRNCVYHGPFNAALMEMNDYASWRKLWGNSEPDSRMLDVEFILRFFMMDDLLSRETDKRRITLKKELNEYMSRHSNESDEFFQIYKERFYSVTDTVFKEFGVNAFHNLTKITAKNPVQKFATSIHPAIFDAVMVATSQVIAEEYIAGEDTEPVLEKYKVLLRDPEFINCITQRTTDLENIRKRVTLAKQILYGV